MNKELKEQAHKEFDEFLDKHTGKHHKDSLYSTLFSDTVKLRKDLILKEFDSLIDKTVQMTEERIVGIINNYFHERIVEDLEVDVVRTKDEHTATRIFEARKNRDEILSLITNKSDINSNK